MIVARSPMRISLGGGGTDLPSYYSRHGSFFISAAIDKYSYITINPAWYDEYIIKYSQLERVYSIEEINHPIIRVALKMLEIGPNIEICSIADIPAGTGLGSSGSFTTALLRALHAYKKNILISAHDLAEQACHIEIEKLNNPIGKQDQYIAAYGGVTYFDINTSGHVSARPACVSSYVLHTLEDHLAIFFTGFSRSASALLKNQDDRSQALDNTMIDNLHYTQELGFKVREALESENLHQFGMLMHDHWLHKQQRSEGMSNTKINELYHFGLQNGAIGGKLVGAGGGGFLMFYTENKQKLRGAMKRANINELRFKFDFEGTKLIF